MTEAPASRVGPEALAPGATPGQPSVISPPARRPRSRRAARSPSAARFRSLLETLPEWVWETDADSRFTYVGPQCEDLLGLEPEALTGTSLLDLVPEEASRRLRKAAANGPGDGRAIAALSTMFKGAGGRQVPVELTAAPFFGRRHEFLGFRGAAHEPADPRPDHDLRREAERWASLVRSTADCIWETDRDGVIKHLSGRNGKVFGYDPEELVGRHLLDLLAPRDRGSARDQVFASLRSRTAFSAADLSVLTKDGSPLVLDVTAVPLYDDDGEFDGFQGAGHDVTQRKQAERALEYRDEVLDAVTRAAAMLVGAPSVGAAMPAALRTIGRALGADRTLVVRRPTGEDPLAKLVYAWQRPGLAVKLGHGDFGSTIPADVHEWMEPLSKGQPIVICASAARGGVGEVLRAAHAKSMLLVPIMAEGRWWGQIGIDDCAKERAWSAAETDSLQIFANVVGASITRERHEAERRRAEEELRLRARIDPLTGMANRIVFEEALRGALKEADAGESRFAIHYLDLDHFKDVNDTLGHPIGDLLLQAVAERLRSVTRHTDFLARFGGDEFAILQADVADPGEAGVLAGKLLSAIRQPYWLQGHEVHIGASDGIAIYDPDAADAEVLLTHAELALYRAKSEGRQTFRFFTDSMDEEMRSRVRLSDQLRKAIDGEQFFLVYQPQVSMHDGRIVGLEALIRWRHPERGLVSPSEFIVPAERNGLIHEIGQWTLRTACRQAKTWLDAGIKCPTVAVNMSAVQLRRPAEAERDLVAILEEIGLPRDVLQLELTETTLMEVAKAQVDMLERLHADGIRISLDDFGTGYSSLDYLRRYPVDQLKIAQVFVAGVTDNPGDAAIVKAAISLARELNLRVIAEGVETLEQARVVLAWGCPEAQGYYFARPMSAEAVEVLLRRGRVDTTVAPPEKSLAAPL